jgi:hypothetical protein
MRSRDLPSVLRLISPRRAPRVSDTAFGGNTGGRPAAVPRQADRYIQRDRSRAPQTTRKTLLTRSYNAWPDAMLGRGYIDLHSAPSTPTMPSLPFKRLYSYFLTAITVAMGTALLYSGVVGTFIDTLGCSPPPVPRPPCKPADHRM